MKEKAEVAEKYSDFNALLMSRTKIVLGMGIRQFFRLFNKKNQWTIAIGIILYLLVLIQVVSIALLGVTYPCDEYVLDEAGNVEKECRTIEFYQGFSKMLVILIACLASSGLISNDLKNDSIHLYLSRPISRTDYLVARFIPIFLLLMIYTTLPNLLVYFGELYDSGFEMDWLNGHKWLLLGIIVQGMLYSFAYSIIGLTFSAAINRESFAAGGFFLSIYGLLIIVEFARFFIENDAVLILSISHQLELISYDIYDLDYFVYNLDEGGRVLLDLNSLWIYGSFFLVIGSCLAFLQWTIYQMEVTK